MPKIEIWKDDLDRLVRKRLKDEELEEALVFAKTELEEFDRKSGRLRLDIKDSNRPDLWSAEGIARELRGHLGIEKGVPGYRVSPSGVVVNIDRKVQRIRPLMVAAVIKGLRFSDRAIEQMIQLQEKLATSYGRKRKEAAIGIFDFDRIKPPLRYTAMKDYEIKFRPLDMKEELTPGQILQRHPKGIEYGHLLAGDYFPILIDSNNNVCSMPPIINSEWTGRVTEKTQNVFVECTGYNPDIVGLALNVMATALAERGGQLQSVTIAGPDGKKLVTPNLDPGTIKLDPEYARKFLGLQISDEEMLHLLSQSRYDVRMIAGKKIEAKYPAYRNDVMHARDVVEDIGIAFGYNEIQPEIPGIPSAGSAIEFEEWCDSAAELMVGLGFQEIFTFIMTGKDSLFSKMRMKEYPICEIANPVSASWNAMRNWLTPGILNFLTKNMHVEYPHRVFEIGDALWIDEKLETKAHASRKLAAAISGALVSYENCASALDALLRNLGIKYEIRPKEFAYCIPGRSGEIRSAEKFLGTIGEIHPAVLNNWGLEKAVVHFEVDLGEIWKLLPHAESPRLKAS